jgi:uncharacterized protein
MTNKLREVDGNYVAGKYGGMVTYTGKVIYVMNPDPADICIEDIAHATANTCRYSGHVKRYYSVAEHQYIMSFMVPLEDALYALIHDSPEGYLTDIPRPFKKQIPGYAEIEDRVYKAILGALGMEIKPLPPSVKKADEYILGIEQACLMPKTKYWPPMLTDEEISYFWTDISPIPTLGLVPSVAEKVYLKRYEELCNG